MVRFPRVLALIVCLSLLVVLPQAVDAQHRRPSPRSTGGAADPGPRGGPAAAGGALEGATPAQQQFFNDGLGDFMEIDSVSGTVPGEEASGLGPSFNGNSCAQCHAQPSVGGSSPGLSSPQNPIQNPQVALASANGARNAVPSFIQADGPVREARFVRHADGSPDGGVYGLFTIAGRTDAAGCNLAQPDFARQLRAGNVIFRIPTPLFGLGLVEATPDTTLMANLAANRAIKAAFGIRGGFNMSGNDGTITRFGWKAQNKSLMVFAGEAYNVEQGVSNEAFINERSALPGCTYNGSPEDATHVDETGSPSETSSDLVNFSMFMRLLAPPKPAAFSASAKSGWALFNAVGCGLCHTPTLTTGMSHYGMSNAEYHPFSDFAVHHMGSGLSDGVSQGTAGPDQFRTAPLWGVGQRLFFLHDGRTDDLLEAIQAHRSNGSEANGVVSRFNQLRDSQVQDMLNFLRSL